MKSLVKVGMLAAVLVPGWAAGQEVKKAEKPAQGNIEPAAAKLLADSQAAMKKVRDVSVDVSQTDPTGAKKGSVAFIKEENPESPFPIGAYRVGLVDSKGTKTKEYASDGKRVVMVDHAARKVLSVDMKPGMVPPVDVMALLPLGFFLTEPQGAKVISVTAKGDSEVGGVKCKVVEQVFEIAFPQGQGKLTMTFVRHIAEDLLLRKLDVNLKIQGPQTRDETLVSVLTNLKVNAGLKAADLVGKTPEGYKEDKGTYAALGMQDPDAQNEMPKLNAEVGKPALAFKLKDPAGKEVSLESLKGRVVLLDFWATWCGPCKMAMPGLQKLHEKYDGKPVTIVGVNCMEEDDKLAVKYMADKKFTYTLLLKGDDLARAYGVTGIPTLILIDQEGKVLSTTIGFDPALEESLAKVIDKALAAKK